MPVPSARLPACLHPTPCARLPVARPPPRRLAPRQVQLQQIQTTKADALNAVKEMKVRRRCKVQGAGPPPRPHLPHLAFGL